MINPQTQSHLKILSILHYVMAAFSVFGLVMVGVYGWFLGQIDPSMFDTAREAREWAQVLPLIHMVLVFVSLFSLLGVGLNIAAGRMLAVQQGRGWVIAASCFNVINLPLGTALAVFTLIVITKNEVSEAFAGRA